MSLNFAFITSSPLSEWDRNILQGKVARAGIPTSSIRVTPASSSIPECDTIIPLDDQSLKALTGKSGIRKWHMSPLTLPSGQKVMPCLSPSLVRREPHVSTLIELTLSKAFRFRGTPWKKYDYRFITNPPVDEAIALLTQIKSYPWLSIDIETGRGQINTFGVAWSDTEALALNVLPENYDERSFFLLWKGIADLLEGPAQKIMQNGVFERMNLARYGISINRFTHDTMCAMRLLWPEYEKGLDNVGRFYTDAPYWKDLGRIAAEEGKQKDWGDIRDWDTHYLYNQLDTSKTFEAAERQREDMRQRGLLTLHEQYVARLYDPMGEMAVRGVPIDARLQAVEAAEAELRLADLQASLTDPSVNLNSPKQKMTFLRGKGFRIPTKAGKETTDKLAVKKLRQKYPDDPDLPILLEVSERQKELSSYLRVRTQPDGAVRYSFDPLSTETGRSAAKKDPWDGGLNIQTVPKGLRKLFRFPPSAYRTFVEIDLRQAESRFVAYDSCDETLIRMLEDGEDIHSYVAAEIYSKPPAEISKDERQLGKKSGHGANYDMGVTTFQDSCLKEMDLVIDKAMASRVLNAYHKLFPGIRRWHSRIRETVVRKRHLANPLGLERYFYGRMDDNTFREAYAYRPQSTIPMITNYLMFALAEERAAGRLNFWFHAQVHDSLVLSCPPTEVPRIAAFAYATEGWHPEIILPAGHLVIPTEVAAGPSWGDTDVIPPDSVTS